MPVSLPGKFHGWRSLAGYSPWDCKELDMTEQLHSQQFRLPWWLRRQRISLQCRRPGFDPWVGKIPRRREWLPTPVRQWATHSGTLAWKILWTEDKESDRTDQLHFHFSLSCIGEGKGNPLQCSCLENHRDGGAWQAAVYGVAQSQTRLKQLSSQYSCLESSMDRGDWWATVHGVEKSWTRLND